MPKPHCDADAPRKYGYRPDAAVGHRPYATRKSSTGSRRPRSIIACMGSASIPA